MRKGGPLKHIVNPSLSHSFSLTLVKSETAEHPFVGAQFLQMKLGSHCSFLAR